MTLSVRAVLDQHLQRTSPPREPDGFWHPSSLFGCGRQAFYEVRGDEASNERTAKSRGILNRGTSVHELVQRAMVEDSGAKAVYNEVSVTIPELNITGHADTLLQFLDDEYELLEFKSIGERGLAYGDLPKLEHERQARTYMMGLRNHGGEVESPGQTLYLPALGDKLARIRIVYFSRDNLQGQEFVLPYDPDFDDWLTTKMADLEAHKTADVLPARLPLVGGKKNWLCKDYCLYRTRCWDVDPKGGLS